MADPKTTLKRKTRNRNKSQTLKLTEDKQTKVAAKSDLETILESLRNLETKMDRVEKR